MLDRLAEIETKYEDLAEQINDPDVIANQTEWRKALPCWRKSRRRIFGSC